MMMRLAIAGLAILLASCGSEKSGTVETEDGTVAYDVTKDGDQAAVSVTGPDGEKVRMQSGAGAEVDLLPGFTIPDGAEVLSNTTINQNDGQGILVSLKSSAAPAELVEHYRKEAEAAGVKMQMQNKTGDTQMIGGQNDKGLSFSFTASKDGSGSTGQLMLGMELLK
jgi:hypothetical protein